MGTRSGLESTLVGVAGEYFVAAELSIRGYLASITLRNSRGIDVIAICPDCKKKHGWFPWQKAFWTKRIGGIVDGGPVRVVPIRCRACELAHKAQGAENDR